MNLRLERTELHPAYTMGQLSVDGKHECWVLEDTVRAGAKIHGATAIPAGRYRVVRDWSNRFRRYMLHLLDVPGFAGVRIHAGNTVADTEGCLLVGMDRLNSTVQRSRAALAALESKTDAVFAAGEEVWIDVANMEEPKA